MTQWYCNIDLAIVNLNCTETLFLPSFCFKLSLNKLCFRRFDCNTVDGCFRKSGAFYDSDVGCKSTACRLTLASVYCRMQQAQGFSPM